MYGLVTRGASLRLGAAVAAVALGACEVPLDPIAPSDLHFSMSGYLDASADTQWVRVEPFGRTAGPIPGPIAAEVVLVTPDGGRQPMAQEVRTLAAAPAHLFWTTADVAPGETYQVVARDASGAEARATVAVPDDRDVTITLEDGFFSCPTAVRVGGAVALVDVEVRYELLGVGRNGERFRFDKLPSLAEGVGGTFDAFAYFGDDALVMEISGLPGDQPVASEFVVVLGTEDWPDVAGLALEDALAEVSLGRVEGGVGFVGGAVTKTIPFVPGFGRYSSIPGLVEPEPCRSAE